MPGLYVHIPFCLQACYYCDFHYKARTDRKPDMLKAIQREAILRSGEWPAESTGATWYFGGGTPTVLTAEDWTLLKDTLSPFYPCHGEWTVEANPEDLTPEYLSMLATLGVNRLSIGIQSFDDGVLRWMHRRHTAERAVETHAVHRHRPPFVVAVHPEVRRAGRSQRSHRQKRNAVLHIRVSLQYG